jgi:hypothetical protein
MGRKRPRWVRQRREGTKPGGGVHPGGGVGAHDWISCYIPHRGRDGSYHSSHLSSSSLHSIIGFLRRLSCVVSIPKRISGPQHANCEVFSTLPYPDNILLPEPGAYVAPPFYFIALFVALGSLLSCCSWLAWLVALGSISDVLRVDPHSAFLKALKVEVHSCPDSPH